MAAEITNNMVPKSGYAGKSSSEATNDNLNPMFRFRTPTELSSIEPYPVPDGFGSEKWNKEKSSLIRIWRGIDGLPSTVRYPDGVIFKRDLSMWPKSNGYNPAIFELNGEPRLTSLKDLKYLQRLNPLVKPENVIYRKDFIVYMDFEMGVLRNGEGKLMDARPQARRGQYDQIMDRGLTGAALENAKRAYVLEAERYADWLAKSDRRNTEFFEQGISYHGKKQSEDSLEDHYGKMSETQRLYPQNEETEFALRHLENPYSFDIAMEILSKNFMGGSADTYLNAVISRHYDALGDFYKNQLSKEELLNADISSLAAIDALEGICRRRLMAENGYSLTELCKLSTKEVIEEFNDCIKAGIIDELKGGYLDMGYKATLAQCSYLLKNWDNMYLPAEFTDKYTKEMLQVDALTTSDGERKVERIDASKAFDFNTCMIKLKPYLTDQKLETITSVEMAVKEAKKYYEKVVLNARDSDGKVIGSLFEGGKVTKAQGRELKAHELEPKDFKDYEAAQAKINTFEPTKWQIDTAKRFMKEEDIKRLNRGELQQAINDNKAEYMKRMHSEVAIEIKKYAMSHGLTTEGASYTNEMWAKDSLNIPPTRSQLAMIHKNALEADIINYAEHQAKQGNTKFVDSKGDVIHSAALYEAVINAKERQFAEKANGPMDAYQKNFFSERKIDVPENTTYKVAREVMLSTLYHEKLLGAQNYNMIVSRNIDLGEKLTAKIHVYGMNDAERAEVRSEVAKVCDEIRKEERQNKIDNVYVGDNTLFGSVRNFINDYKASHKGSVKGVEEAIVRAYKEDRLTQPGESLVAEKGSYSMAVGHVMASVLPDCVGNYSKSMEKFAVMVGEKAKEATSNGR